LDFYATVKEHSQTQHHANTLHAFQYKQEHSCCAPGLLCHSAESLSIQKLCCAAAPGSHALNFCTPRHVIELQRLVIATSATPLQLQAPERLQQSYQNMCWTLSGFGLACVAVPCFYSPYHVAPSPPSASHQRQALAEQRHLPEHGEAALQDALHKKSKQRSLSVV
jgi:hypothetical protein